MLLVDVPHLASVADRSGVIDCVTDDRLRPLVQAVLEGAKEGRDPDLEALLQHVDEASHQQIYASVFAGEYRGLGDGNEGGATDPQHVLGTLVRGCQAEDLDRRIAQIKGEIRDAQAQGYPDRARDLAKTWMDLRRQHEQLLNASGPLEPPPNSMDPDASLPN